MVSVPICSTPRLGVDLGGTKIELRALDGVGRELHRERVATPQGDYAGTLAAIAGLVARADAVLGASGSVGVGIPGSLSPATGRVRNANSTCLNGRTLLTDLEAVLDRAVRVENDANCLALAEATDGAAEGANVVFAVILGTGVGGGLALGGRVHAGRNRIAGEWGHDPLPRPVGVELPGPACWCGRHGCVEAWCSGPALAADCRRHAVDASRWPDARAVVAGLRAGEPCAVAAWTRWLDRLGRALARVVNLLDPDAIVFAGGLSLVDELHAGLPAALVPHLFSDAFDTPLLRAAHGDASGARGAALLWGK